MWKLKIKRKYTGKYKSDDYTCEDFIEYESEKLDDLAIIIDNNRRFAVNGEFEYQITYEEKGEK